MYYYENRTIAYAFLALAFTSCNSTFYIYRQKEISASDNRG